MLDVVEGGRVPQAIEQAWRRRREIAEQLRRLPEVKARAERNFTPVLGLLVRRQAA